MHIIHYLDIIYLLSFSFSAHFSQFSFLIQSLNSQDTCCSTYYLYSLLIIAGNSPNSIDVMIHPISIFIYERNIPKKSSMHPRFVCVCAILVHET